MVQKLTYPLSLRIWNQQKAQALRQVSDLPKRKPLSFDSWLTWATPTWHWEWQHLVYIRQYLNKITTGEIKRLMVFVPPRFGKTEQNTVRYPVWRLTQNPQLRVIIGAYNQILANKFSRKARRIGERCLDLSKDRLAVEDWETAQGGGIRAVGVGGGITGQGGDLILIDDPVKNREEAESEAYRNRCWDWYTDDLYTRLEPNGAIILMMTRWNEADLAGRILASEDAPNWTVVRLTAEAEDGDPLGRELGEALCPERYDLTALQEVKKVLGSSSYQALYQQRPTAAEGNLFKRAWFSHFADATPARAQWIRYWDMAATAGAGDYTVGLLMGITPDKQIIIADVVRGRWSPGESDKIRLNIAELDRQKFGMNVQIWREQEGGSSGKALNQIESKVFSGFNIHFDHPTTNKIVRAGPLAAQCEAGNVSLFRSSAWNGAFIDELCSFPSGKNDDQVDTASGAYNALAAQSGWARGSAG